MAQNFNRSVFVPGTVKYTDIDFSFLAHPFTGDLRKKTDLDAIKQSLKNILYTFFGERPFQPEFGSHVWNLLFEPFDGITKVSLEEEITNAILNFEPRITPIEVNVTDNSDNNEIAITVSYNVNNLTDIETLNMIIKRRR